MADSKLALQESMVDQRSDWLRIGWSSTIAALAVLVTPLIVFGGESLFLQDFYPEGIAQNVYIRDPFVSSQLPALGVVYALQALTFAAAAGVAGLAAHRILGPGSRGQVALAGAFAGSALWLVNGGVSAAQYSAPAIIADTIVAVQPDAAVRRMTGFGNLYETQGLLGAASIGIALLALCAALGARGSGRIGSPLLVLVAVFGVLIVVLYGAGLGGATALVCVPLFAALAIVSFRASRAAAGARS